MTINKEWLQSFCGKYIKLKYKDYKGNRHEVTGVIPDGGLFDEFMIFSINTEKDIRLFYNRIENIICTLGNITKTVEPDISQNEEAG